MKSELLTAGTQRQKARLPLVRTFRHAALDTPAFEEACRLAYC